MLVFFHGGRFEQGSEGVELYDARNIANLTDTIVVTVNYRSAQITFEPLLALPFLARMHISGLCKGLSTADSSVCVGLACSAS